MYEFEYVIDYQLSLITCRKRRPIYVQSIIIFAKIIPNDYFDVPEKSLPRLLLPLLDQCLYRLVEEVIIPASFLSLDDTISEVGNFLHLRCNRRDIRGIITEVELGSNTNKITLLIN